MKFARTVYIIAAVYGILVIAPMYFMETSIAQESRQRIEHPEFFYGFLGVTLSWQIAFLLIASDPIRYRLLMLVTWLEKLSFGVAVPILYLQNRVSLNMLMAAGIDIILLVLFITAFVLTTKEVSAKQ